VTPTVKRLFLAVAMAALAIGLVQTVHGRAIAQSAPQASPTPILPPGAIPTGQPGNITISLPTPKPKAKASPKPAGDDDAQRVGISGVWEVQIQNDSGTVYTHFKLTQNGNGLTGQYLDTNGKKYPIAGTVDGKEVHLVVSMPDGSALVFEGSVDQNTDMAGTLQTAKDLIGFTAAYRPKYKWIDNLSPNPGLPGTP
jgi:hypothetical protein